MTHGELDVHLSPLEVATGLVFGTATRAHTTSVVSKRRPLDALEQAILPALQRSPCLVSFSGGRDSSCVLAAATSLARREGLPLPVPATNRFADAPDTDESDWQERVVGHLGLNDWLRLDFHDELDAVGPIACGGLKRHGLLWPFNVHFHLPLLEAARGGALLTGIGGDEIFSESRWSRANDVLARRVRPVPRDAPAVLLSLSPCVIRRAVLRSRPAALFPWLRPAARRALARASTDREASEPRRYAARLRWWRSLRSFAIGVRSLALLADDTGALLVHPLADPLFAAALANFAPAGGPAERGRFMSQVFGDLLPVEVYRRRTKAHFDQAFWGPHSRALAQEWDGEGVDRDFVEVDGLRAEWARAVPDTHTLTLLQAAWLARNAS